MQQPKRARAFAFLAASAMVMLGVAFVWLHIESPSDGTRFDAGTSGFRPDGIAVVVLRAQPGGLRSGDVVVAVDGVRITSWAEALTNPSIQRPRWQVGQALTYTVVRNGATMDVPVTLIPYPLDAVWREGWSTMIFALVFEFIALYIVLRRPGETAPLVLLISASGILGATAWSFGWQVDDLVGATGLWLYKAATSIDFLLFYIASLHFALIFPRRSTLLEERPRRIWALYATPFVLDAIYLTLTRVLSPTMLAWLGNANAVENILVVLLVIAIIATVTWTYLRNHDADTRSRIRWVMFGVLVSAISGLLLWELPGVVLGRPLISANALGLLALPLPLSLAIAVLRHHLFDIDTILNRTLVYSALSGIVAGIYIAIVAALGSFFQARGSLLIALLAAGVVAVLFQPLRLWLQRSVDRLLFGERDNPYAVLSRLGRRLETAIAPEMVLPTIVETVAHALKLPSVAIALKEGEQFTLGVAYGVPVGAQVVLPLVYQSELVGELRVSPRAPDESFTDADKHLLEDIAHQAGIAVHTTRLTADLQRSRARLVTTREEERRRLRRDLHDGIGPTLAGMTLKVGAIRNVLTSNPAAADRMLGELGGEIESAIGDIRRLVYALRPPALDEHGLVGALRALAAQYQLSAASEANGVGAQPKLLVTVDASAAIPALPAAVEVAAYRIASEALTNTARHARARTCRVTLACDTALRLEICDDGTGIAPDHRLGVGMVSMRERAEELDGTCSVTSEAGRGTCVLAALPLARE